MVLYDIGLFLVRIWLSIIAVFNKKIRAGIDGRKDLFERLQTHYDEVLPERKCILIHVSSYGELEQAKPIIEALRADQPDVHLHLTFFSPSGYLNAVGKYRQPDLITYLPFDTKYNVRRFLDLVKPDVVLFARYDVWHNLARELKARNIPSILFSATFSDSSVKLLPIVKRIQLGTYQALTKIFCISQRDSDAFAAYGVNENSVEVAGDTRYDQVMQRKELSEKQRLEISGSLHDRLTAEGVVTLVAGSTWPEDEELLQKAWTGVLEKHEHAMLVIAPHEVDEAHIAALEGMFTRTARLSFYNGARVVIVDSIGKLFDLYRYACVAYVGGGFGAGVHNVLEPAVWGVPVIVGPRHERSQEVLTLIGENGAYEVRTSSDLSSLLKQFIDDPDRRRISGSAAKAFVEQGRGAQNQIVTFARKLATLHTPS